MIGNAVIEAATELLGARNYSSVVAVATDTLAQDPGDIEMRLLRARALLALRRDEEAQTDLRECLRRQTRCAVAYTLLGELCFRRDELDSAAVFLREALRLNRGDQHAQDLLSIVEGLSARHDFIKPTAVVEKLPAATAAVGPLSPQDLDGPTEVEVWPLANEPAEAMDDLTGTEAGDSVTQADPPDTSAHLGLLRAIGDDGPPTVNGRPARRPLGSSCEGSVADAPHRSEFGGYLMQMGALTASELARARDYQAQSRVSLAEAVIALGYATEPTVMTASLAFQAEQQS